MLQGTFDANVCWRMCTSNVVHETSIVGLANESVNEKVTVEQLCWGIRRNQSQGGECRQNGGDAGCCRFVINQLYRTCVDSEVNVLSVTKTAIWMLCMSSVDIILL